MVLLYFSIHKGLEFRNFKTCMTKSNFKMTSFAEWESKARLKRFFEFRVALFQKPKEKFYVIKCIFLSGPQIL